MFKKNRLIPDKRETLAFFMLSFFFVTMALCSIQKVNAAPLRNQVEMTKQPKTAVNVTSSSLSCSLENNPLTSSIIDVEHSVQKNIAQSLALVLLVCSLFSFFKKEEKLLFHAADYTFSISPLPVYLKHRSLII